MFSFEDTIEIASVMFAFLAVSRDFYIVIEIIEFDTHLVLINIIVSPP